MRGEFGGERGALEPLATGMRWSCVGLAEACGGPATQDPE